MNRTPVFLGVVSALCMSGAVTGLAIAGSSTRAASPSSATAAGPAWTPLRSSAGRLAGQVAARPRYPQVAADPAPPGQPTTGYGSSQKYIATTWAESQLGSTRDGTAVWWYVPNVLKNGSTAPVVVFNHGWTAYLPKYYIGLIEHLVKEGNIVVYPQYQKGGLHGIGSDTDQTQFLARAISSVNEAMKRIGSLATPGETIIAGHSLGGLISLCWNAAGGIRGRELVLLNGEYNAADSTPPWVDINYIDWLGYVDLIDVPVMLLTGNEDPYNAESLTVYDALVNSPSRVVYLANSDYYGTPDIVADHVAVLNAGSDGDALDFRFYAAAIDAALDHRSRVTFDFGNWSDGTPVTAVTQQTP